MAVDAQSEKSTASADHKDYDASQKVSGIKRHIAVDNQGLPRAIAVATGDETDRKRTLWAIDRCAANLKQVKNVLAGGGYTGKPFIQAAQEKLGATVQIAKCHELHTFAVIP